MTERIFRVVRNGASVDMTFAEIRTLAPRDLTDDGLRHRIWRLEKKGPVPLELAIESRAAAKMRSPWRNLPRRAA